MNISQQNMKIKRIKRIKLKGLAVQVRGIQKQQKQAINNKKKQQEIQNSSLQQDQLQYYSDNLQNALYNTIEQLLGQNIQYEVIQLKQSNIKDLQNQEFTKMDKNQYFDIVLRVKFSNQDLQIFQQKISRIRSKQQQKKQNYVKKQLQKNKQENRNKSKEDNYQKQNKNAKLMSLQYFIKQKENQQKQQTKETEQIQYELQQERKLEKQSYLNHQLNQKDSSCERQPQFEQTAKAIMINQSSQQLSYSLKGVSKTQKKPIKNKSLTKKGNKTNNKKNKCKDDIKITYIDKKNIPNEYKYGKTSFEQHEQNNTEQSIDQNQKKKQGNKCLKTKVKNDKKLFSNSGFIFILIASSLFLLFVAYHTLNLKQKQVTKKIIKINENSVPYFATIPSKFAKTPFVVVKQIVQQNNDFYLYEAIMPAVNSVNQSLHPKNLSYIRPTQTRIFSFAIIKQMSGVMINNTNFISRFSDAEIDTFMSQLEDRHKTPLNQALYNQIASNLLQTTQSSLNQNLLMEAQYKYVVRKYPQIDRMEKLQQKPFCIVNYAQNQLKNKRFIPFFKSILTQNYTNLKVIYINDGPSGKYELPLIMNYIRRNFEQQLIQIGIKNLYFLQHDNKIGKSLSKNAAIRQFCGDGQIVLQLDSNNLLLGRQSLRLISSLYDGGYDKNIMDSRQNVPQNLNQPDINKNIKNQNAKPKEVKPNNSQLKTQNFQPMARKLGSIWLMQTDYLLKNNVQSPQKMFYVNSTKQITSQYNLYEGQSKKSLNQILSNLQKNQGPIFSTCIKSYVLQLQTKIPDQQLMLQHQFQNQIRQYSGQIYSYLSLLELSNRFGKQKHQKGKNFISLSEPICLKIQDQLQGRCKKRLKVFQQFKSLQRDNLMSLQQLIGNQIQVISIQNSLKSNQQYQNILKKLQKHIKDNCNNLQNN